MRNEAFIDTTEMDRAMGDIEQRAKRLAPAFRELRRPFRGDQRAHARGEEGPNGRWLPRSPLTEARLRSRNRTARRRRFNVLRRGEQRMRSAPRRLLGRLPGAIIVTVGDLFIRAVSRVSWSGVHQRGGRAGHGRRVDIPARQFLWLSEKLLAQATEVLGGYVLKGWKR